MRAKARKGQVLTMVLLIMTVGTLVILPLLAYLDVSMRISAGSTSSLADYYAAEGAIDSLTTELLLGEDISDDPYRTLNISGRSVDVTIAAPQTIDPLSTVTYDFDNALSGSNAWYIDSDDTPPESNPNTRSELSSSDKNKIKASDNQRYTSPDPGSYDEASIECDFVISEDIHRDSVTQIQVEWEGYGESSSDDIRIYLKDTTDNGWDLIGYRDNCPTSDTVVTGSLTSNAAKYVSSSSHINFCIQNHGSSQTITTDYVELTVVHTPPPLYLDPGLVFWLTDMAPGYSGEATFDFLLKEVGDVNINWGLYPSNQANSYASWTITILQGAVVKASNSGTGTPGTLSYADLYPASYVAKFEISYSGSASKNLYSMPFKGAGGSDYTWLKIQRGYQGFVVTAVCGDVTIDAYMLRSPGLSAWWQPQEVNILSWNITRN